MNWPRYILRLIWGLLCFGFGFLWATHQHNPPWTLGVLLLVVYVTIEGLTEPRKNEIR